MRSNRSKGIRTGLTLVALAVGMAPSVPRAQARATEGFRQEHEQVRIHLGHVRVWVGELAAAEPAQQKELAQKVVRFFEEDIRPHAEWEEAKLYPVVDKLVGAGRGAFTSTMRYEHRIIDRWIRELVTEAQKPRPDYAEFARRADNLLGVVDAHFEKEEQVLLPHVDRRMSRAQFEKQVGSPGH